MKSRAGWLSSRSRQHTTHKRRKADLLSYVHFHLASECDDYHDRVYALQALYRGGESFPIDYETAKVEFLLNLSLFCSNELLEHQDSRTPPDHWPIILGCKQCHFQGGWVGELFGVLDTIAKATERDEVASQLLLTQLLNPRPICWGFECEIIELPAFISPQTQVLLESKDTSSVGLEIGLGHFLVALNDLSDDSAQYRIVSYYRSFLEVYEETGLEDVRVFRTNKADRAVLVFYTTYAAALVLGLPDKYLMRKLCMQAMAAKKGGKNEPTNEGRSDSPRDFTGDPSWCPTFKLVPESHAERSESPYRPTNYFDHDYHSHE